MYIHTYVYIHIYICIIATYVCIYIYTVTLQCTYTYYTHIATVDHGVLTVHEAKFWPWPTSRPCSSPGRVLPSSCSRTRALTGALPPMLPRCAETGAFIISRERNPNIWRFENHKSMGQIYHWIGWRELLKETMGLKGQGQPFGIFLWIFSYSDSQNLSNVDFIYLYENPGESMIIL